MGSSPFAFWRFGPEEVVAVLVKGFEMQSGAINGIRRVKILAILKGTCKEQSAHDLVKDVLKEVGTELASSFAQC